MSIDVKLMEDSVHYTQSLLALLAVACLTLIPRFIPRHVGIALRTQMASWRIGFVAFSNEVADQFMCGQFAAVGTTRICSGNYDYYFRLRNFMTDRVVVRALAETQIVNRLDHFRTDSLKPFRLLRTMFVS